MDFLDKDEEILEDNSKVGYYELNSNENQLFLMIFEKFVERVLLDKDN